MRTRLVKWSLLLGAAAVLALPLASWAQLTTFDLEKTLNAESHVGNLAGHAKDAAAPYRRYCVGCHGTLGDGEGENAAWMEAPMYQKPRNFQLGVFKCRSTPTGTLPADQDLYDAITRGFDRSNMPQWNTLTKQERTDLVAWVKHFSPRFATEKPGTPITIPTRTGSHCGAHHGRTRRICQGAVLEVSRRAGYGQWAFGCNPHRRFGPGDRAFQLYRWIPAEVRRHGSGYLPYLHDRFGRHSHAVVRRQHQAR